MSKVLVSTSSIVDSNHSSRNGVSQEIFEILKNTFFFIIIWWYKARGNTWYPQCYIWYFDCNTAFHSQQQQMHDSSTIFRELGQFSDENKVISSQPTLFSIYWNYQIDSTFLIYYNIIISENISNKIRLIELTSQNHPFWYRFWFVKAIIFPHG